MRHRQTAVRVDRPVADVRALVAPGAVAAGGRAAGPSAAWAAGTPGVAGAGCGADCACGARPGMAQVEAWP